MAPNDIQSLFNVDGLVAVITGGGSGLGLYSARALDANGAKAVYIVGRRENVLQEAAETAKNGKIIPIVGDVTDKASLRAITERVREEQGYVNLLFANAGVGGPRDQEILSKLEGKPSIQQLQEILWNSDMALFSQAYHVNTTAVYYTAVAFLDLLDAGNRAGNVPQKSQILVTSSLAGFSRSLSFSFAYSASKAAVTHLVKMLSTKFAQNGFHIRCNIIAPGLYPSELTSKQFGGLGNFSSQKGHENDFSDAHVMAPSDCPAERTGSEQDFAGAILFMASRAGAYLDGACMLSDGGRLSQLPATF